MRIAVPIPKKRLSSCRPVTLTVFESILYATASREFHSNPVPLKMCPVQGKSTGSGETVLLDGRQISMSGVYPTLPLYHSNRVTTGDRRCRPVAVRVNSKGLDKAS